jgi:hypothetical protein
MGKSRKAYLERIASPKRHRTQRGAIRPRREEEKRLFLFEGLIDPAKPAPDEAPQASKIFLKELHEIAESFGDVYTMLNDFLDRAYRRIAPTSEQRQR